MVQKDEALGNGDRWLKICHLLTRRIASAEILAIGKLSLRGSASNCFLALQAITRLVTVIQLCCCSSGTAIDDGLMEWCDRVSIKLYLTNGPLAWSPWCGDTCIGYHKLPVPLWVWKFILWSKKLFWTQQGKRVFVFTRHSFSYSLFNF